MNILIDTVNSLLLQKELLFFINFFYDELVIAVEIN